MYYFMDIVINLDFFIPIINSIIQILCMIIPLLIAVAYLTLFERKVMAAIQRRQGPNEVGIFGLLQPLADGLKLLLKETILPANANIVLFLFSPILTFMLALVTWAVIPFDEDMVYADLNLGILYLLAISSLGVYGILISGWSSNSKYAFLGGLRSAAQMVSYEVSMGLILCTVLACSGSFNLSEIVESQQSIWYIVPLLPSWVMFFISSLAETNRAPFDLPEAEAELVAGYNVEYSAMGFALFFLGEYANMLLMSGMSAILFLGGWLSPFSEESIFYPFFSFIPGYIWFGMKLAFIVFLFIWVRASLPRFRYDQLMSLGWKVFLPFSLAWLIFVIGILLSFNMLPI